MARASDGTKRSPPDFRGRGSREGMSALPDSWGRCLFAVDDGECFTDQPVWIPAVRECHADRVVLHASASESFDVADGVVDFAIVRTRWAVAVVGVGADELGANPYGFHRFGAASQPSSIMRSRISRCISTSDAHRSFTVERSSSPYAASHCAQFNGIFSASTPSA